MKEKGDKFGCINIKNFYSSSKMSPQTRWEDDSDEMIFPTLLISKEIQSRV